MNRFDRFQQLIDEPAPPSPPQPSAELVQPLQDLARALEAKAQVGAGVQPSSDRRRYHLVLWPLHRPAFRSMMMTVQITNGRGTVISSPAFHALMTSSAMVQFTTADGLTGWLERFVQQPEFKATLAALQEQAREPVDARLERSNGMATLVGVSPEQQEALDRLPKGDELPLELELNNGEPVPDAGALRYLDSAGLRFEISGPTVTGRKVQMRVVKVQ